MIHLKKIAYIGHSYHAKTQSTKFLLDLLSKSYDVEVILNESWQGKKEPELSHINSTYSAVIFFQIISRDMLKQITCENVIYFPMYDSCVGAKLEDWYPYRNIKIFNFSKTLHETLKKWGFNTAHIQFYPEYIGSTEIDTQSVFFWQRTNSITWTTVKKLIANLKIESVHIHRAVDPGNEFESPSLEDEAKYNITYSDWFNTKDDYMKAVQSKSIYIAPRIYEGIGFSFLEAMALGKVVIAPDNPTMNEYIKHGINGYLYKVNNVVPIHINSIKELQDNLKECMLNGKDYWERNKYKIINFMEEPQKFNNYLIAQGLKVKLIINSRLALKKIKNFINLILPYRIKVIYKKAKLRKKVQ